MKNINNEIAVIIPTYNAREGIISNISKILHQAPFVYIIIVDDSSPDGTASLIQSKFINDKRVQIIIRKNKGGRGSAVIVGLKKALKNKETKYFIEMDADLCHNPKYIKKLVDKCVNADVVIASRYLPSSRISGWNFKRKLMSFCINNLAKFLLRIPITDYTDGFRCYSRKAVEFITTFHVKSQGYIVLSEIAYICYKKGLIFAQVPIDFHFKEVSKSNLNWREVIEALWTLIRLRFIDKL
ncbi:polyprenol monophosphomannose synthase [Patescibacteria group bacterium]|nr:polyprenol monophosphomannose synthase [Patescibacteria group bacterium]MBU4016662.1 polyprenol monophosphomannose synthase [Patescibacteria group bacterium]MBU4099546.1 polyprenol monophosphomannose synthase [Patescibacteria group bacterium]